MLSIIAEVKTQTVDHCLDGPRSPSGFISVPQSIFQVTNFQVCGALFGPRDT